ncbi:MAG TPA: hypothetical protein VKB80_16840 [Kofleriaceae bacterium]|nr:hypothetical protein [Kofleriaceae bacterium]
MGHALRIALGTTLAVGACTVEEAPTLEEVEFISYNSLAPAAFLDGGDALNALAGGALDGATTGLVDTEDGRALLSYVVRCALATGDSAAFPRSGAPDLVYTGLLGFAADWKESSLGDTGRRLMTGCLMAHVNAFETQVPISVRNAIVGDAGLAEKLLFPAQELAVYGNYFAAPSEREIYVCFGKAVAQALGAQGGVGGLLPSYLDLRVCSTTEGCGFHRVGACYRWPSMPAVKQGACEVQSGSFYEACHEAPIEVQSTPAWDETVSVYLQPGHLTLLLTEYLELVCELTGGLLC